MKGKILITGGSGLLGSNIVRMVARDFETCATYYSHPAQLSGCTFIPLDIRDERQTLSVLEKIEPELVIHTAALIDVDYCEEHPDEAWSINVQGTENVVRASRKVGAEFIYISTDSVFDGEKGMYVEECTPHPINVYARTKLEGELRVQRWLSEAMIIRTAFYSWGLSGKHSLADWVISQLKGGRFPRMFTDVFFSPVPVNVLVKVILEMYHQRLSGIYHVGGRERCSKYTFGLELAQALGFSGSDISRSVLADARLKAPRPKDISLNVNKILSLDGIYLPDLSEGIVQFMDWRRSLKDRGLNTVSAI